MIKGCQKRVIWLRKTGSELFEEAYFIMSEAACRRAPGEADMIKEANRLIGRTPVGSYWEETEKTEVTARTKTAQGKAIGRFLWFMLGGVSAAFPLVLLLITRG